MSRVRLTPVAFLTALLLLPSSASAQTPTVSAELAYRSHYLWAGIPFSSGGVTQATLTTAWGSFTLNGFASYDLDLSDLNEADVFGDFYAQTSPRVGMFVGAGLYTFEFEEGWESTPEIYAGLVFTAPLTPTITVAHDFDLGDGTHVLLSLSRSVPLGGTGATLGLAGNLDFNDGYWAEVSGFSYADVGASLSIPLGSITLTPMVLAQLGIDDVFVDEQVVGVSASVTF